MLTFKTDCQNFLVFRSFYWVLRISSAILYLHNDQNGSILSQGLLLLLKAIFLATDHAILLRQTFQEQFPRITLPEMNMPRSIFVATNVARCRISSQRLLNRFETCSFPGEFIKYKKQSLCFLQLVWQLNCEATCTANTRHCLFSVTVPLCANHEGTVSLSQRRNPTRAAYLWWHP